MCEKRYSFYYEKCRHTDVMYTADPKCKTPGSENCKIKRKQGMVRGYCPNCRPKDSLEDRSQTPYPSDTGSSTEGGENTKKTTPSSGSKSKGVLSALFGSPKKSKKGQSSKTSGSGGKTHDGAGGDYRDFAYEEGRLSSHHRGQKQSKAEIPVEESISESETDDEASPGPRSHSVPVEWAHKTFVEPLKRDNARDSGLGLDPQFEDGEPASKADQKGKDKAKAPSALSEAS